MKLFPSNRRIKCIRAGLTHQEFMLNLTRDGKDVTIIYNGLLFPPAGLPARREIHELGWSKTTAQYHRRRKNPEHGGWAVLLCTILAIIGTRITVITVYTISLTGNPKPGHNPVYFVYGRNSCPARI